MGKTIGIILCLLAFSVIGLITGICRLCVGDPEQGLDGNFNFGKLLLVICHQLYDRPGNNFIRKLLSLWERAGCGQSTC